MKEFSREQLLKYALRTDLRAFTQRCFNTVVPGERFLPSWHIDAICQALERVLRGETRRLIIAMPPRSMKSICASVAFPAFVLGRDPTRKIICVSYSDTLAAKHANDTRAVMKADWYRATFPKTRIDPAKDSQAEFATTARGFRLATSTGGTLTGRGGNLIVIDDPIKPQDAMSEPARESAKQWFGNTLLSRLDNKEADAIVLVMQRVHVDDLAGHLLEAGGWELLKLAAIAEGDERIPLGPGKFYDRRAGEPLHPARESLPTLEGIRAEIGALNFSAQYQQAPVAPSGNMIRRDWLRYYQEPPERRPGDIVIASWDTAMKESERSDYSVGSVWLIRGDEHFLLDLVRERLAFPSLKRRAEALHQRWRADATIVEDKGSGTSLAQELRKGPVQAIPFKPLGDKEMRLDKQSIKFERGSVYLPNDAPWLGELEAELLAFPSGRHDDQVDSISQALEWADQHRAWPRPRVRRL